MRDAATEIVIDALGEIASGPRPLVAGEDSGRLVKALSGGERHPDEWIWHSIGRGVARPWPPQGERTSAFVRLPKVKHMLDFALHAVTTTLMPGAPVIVFGANDEGVRSAASHVSAVADDVAVLVARSHCRVLQGRRKLAIDGHLGSLSAWRRADVLDIAGIRRPWVSYPGNFAKGGLDEGTALLILSLPRSDRALRILDFASGAGVVAAAAHEFMPDACVDMLEIDALALEAARENVPSGNPIAGSSLSATGDALYDLILSNPPIHDGVAESHAVLEALVSDAPRHLVQEGELRIVVQRRIDAAELMQRVFGACEELHHSSRFRVLAARRRQGH